MRDLQPVKTTLRWNQLEVVEVKVELDGFMATEIEIVIVVGDPLHRRNISGSLYLNGYTRGITKEQVKKISFVSYNAIGSRIWKYRVIGNESADKQGCMNRNKDRTALAQDELVLLDDKAQGQSFFPTINLPTSSDM